MSSRTAKTAADATPKPAGPGRPKDPGKRAAILDAAKRLFPLRYVPSALEATLIGKPVLMGLKDGQPTGVVFVQASLHQ